MNTRAATPYIAASIIGASWSGMLTTTAWWPLGVLTAVATGWAAVMGAEVAVREAWCESRMRRPRADA